MTRPGPKKGSAARNDNTGVSQARRSKVRTLSTAAADAVGRPGFGGNVPGPVDGKSSVRILNNDADPASGIASKAAGRITTQHVDLMGPQNPKMLSTTNVQQPNKSQRVIRPPRSSAPVISNKPGKVTRPRGI
jgi:hypothetical protein